MLEDKRLCLQYVHANSMKFTLQIQAHIHAHVRVQASAFFRVHVRVFFVCTIYSTLYMFMCMYLFNCSWTFVVFIIMKMFVYTFILMDSFIYMFMSYNVLAHGNTHVHKQVREHVDINFLRVALSL